MPRTSRTDRRCRGTDTGLTLLELLVTISIAVIMVGALSGVLGGRPSFADVERKVIGALRQARTDALASGRTVDVRLVKDTLVSSAGAVELPNGITLSLTPPGVIDGDGEQEGIRFFADGSASGGTIVLEEEARRRRISVSWLTGAISHDR